MELKEAERMARTLMTQHGVGRIQFAFDGGKRRLGATHMLNVSGSKIPTKITLSRHYVVLLPEAEVKDVILHEIAHALVPNANHGPAFMAMCRKVGAKPARCAQPSARPQHNIEGRCPKCDCKVSEHIRMPRAAYIHRTCRTRLEYVRL